MAVTDWRLQRWRLWVLALMLASLLFIEVSLKITKSRSPCFNFIPKRDMEQPKTVGESGDISDYRRQQRPKALITSLGSQVFSSRD